MPLCVCFWLCLPTKWLCKVCLEDLPAEHVSTYVEHIMSGRPIYKIKRKTNWAHTHHTHTTSNRNTLRRARLNTYAPKWQYNKKKKKLSTIQTLRDLSEASNIHFMVYYVWCLRWEHSRLCVQCSYVHMHINTAALNFMIILTHIKEMRYITESFK